MLRPVAAVAGSLAAILQLSAPLRPLLGQDTAQARPVFVRISVVHLRLIPGFEGRDVLDSASFGERLLVVQEQGDWLLARKDTSSAPGWLHRLVVATAATEINAVRRSRRIPTQITIVNLAGFGGPFPFVDGTLRPDSADWVSALPPGAAIFVASLPTSSTDPFFGIHTFLNGRFRPGHPHEGSMYYLTAAGVFEPWPH